MKWTLTTYIFIIAFVAGVGKIFCTTMNLKVRVIGYRLEPHNIRGIVTRAGFEVYFEIPLLLWLTAGFMIFLYW